jgi:hypothetical protein
MVRIRNAAALIALALMMTTCLDAQERRQGGAPPYDPSKEVTVSGSVIDTETIEVGSDKRRILMVTIDGAPTGIILGPDAWVEKQGVVFAKGATVQVVGLTGYKYDGHPALMPRTVKGGNKTLTLRDETGKPLWEQ